MFFLNSKILADNFSYKEGHQKQIMVIGKVCKTKFNQGKSNQVQIRPTAAELGPAHPQLVLIYLLQPSQLWHDIFCVMS